MDFSILNVRYGDTCPLLRSCKKALIGTCLCLNYYCRKYTVIQFCVMGRSIPSRKLSIQSSNCNIHVCQNTVGFSLFMPHQPQNLPKICTSYAYINQQSCTKTNYTKRLTNFFSQHICRGSLAGYVSCLGGDFGIRISPAVQLTLFFTE
jgi:hypothetical protein